LDFRAFQKSSSSSSLHLLLIGDPVAHSLSPIMHNTAAKYHNLPMRYYAVRIEREELPAFASYLSEPALKGVNVTIPHKQALLEYMDNLDPDCEQIGALNTIAKENGNLVGYNTDIIGFCEPLYQWQSEIENEPAIVFGTGGAARAIVFGLKKMGVANVLLVSRNPERKKGENWPESAKIIGYERWPEYAKEAQIFVNATPLGMEPDINKSPVRENETPFLAEKICYDVVYRPIQTTFLARAEKVHAKTIGGLDMLIHQGSRSFELWTGHKFPIDLVRDQLSEYIKYAD